MSPTFDCFSFHWRLFELPVCLFDCEDYWPVLWWVERGFWNVTDWRHIYLSALSSLNMWQHLRVESLNYTFIFSYNHNHWSKLKIIISSFFLQLTLPLPSLLSLLSFNWQSNLYSHTFCATISSKVWSHSAVACHGCCMICQFWLMNSSW